jgi:hypothetical protein
LEQEDNMAKADIEFIVDTLRQSKIDDDLIPALAMTAFYESGLEIEAENPETESMGIFQINASSFYLKDGSPDPTLERFFKKINREYTESEFNEFLKNEKYNTIFAAHIIKDFREFSDIDPMTKWEAYTDYVEPFLQGKKIQGKANADVIAGIGAYMDAYLQIHNYQQKEELKENLKNLNDPKTGENRVFHRYFIPNLKAGNIEELDPLKDK